MKRTLLMLAFLAVSGLLSAAPVCQFATLKYEFGDIPQDRLASCEFKFTNTGDQPLELTYVEEPCGFAFVEYTKGAIAPGSAGSIKFFYNPAERPGAFRRTAVVKTNMGQDKDILLMLKGNVLDNKATRSLARKERSEEKGKQGHTAGGVMRSSLKVDAAEFDFGKVTTGASVTHEFKLTNTGDMPLAISAACEQAGVKIEAPQEPIAPGKTITLKVQLTPAAAGNLMAGVLIKKDDGMAIQSLTLKAQVQ